MGRTAEVDRRFIRSFSHRLYGGKNRGWSVQGVLCTNTRRFSAVMVMGRAEQEKFEERDMFRVETQLSHHVTMAAM